MKIILLTNKDCHCVDLEQALDMLGFDYQRCDVEDKPILVERFNIRHCPTLVVNDIRVIPIDDNNITHLRELLVAE